MGPAQIEKADRWFQRHGEMAVLFGRMMPVVRAFVSLPAGVAKMPFVRFTVFSLIGAVPWVLGLALTGHALGGDWKSVRKGFEYVDYAVVAAPILGLAYCSCGGAAAEPAPRCSRLSPGRSLRQALALGMLQGPDGAAADLILRPHRAAALAGRLVPTLGWEARRASRWRSLCTPVPGWHWRASMSREGREPSPPARRADRAGGRRAAGPGRSHAAAGGSSGGWAGRARSPPGCWRDRRR